MADFLVYITLLLYVMAMVSFWIHIYDRKRILNRIGYTFLGLSFLSQLIFIGLKDFEERSFYLTSVEELPYFLAFILTGIYYILSIKYKDRIRDLASFLTSINVILVILSLPMTRLESSSNINFVSSIHILTISISLAFIIVSFILSSIYFVMERNLKRKNLNSVFISKFSFSLETLENIISKVNIMIFLFLSVSILSSSLWLSLSQNKHWFNSAQEIGLIILAIIYGVLIHIKLIAPQLKKFLYIGSILGAILSFIIMFLFKHP